jgi:hypothetical protein
MRRDVLDYAPPAEVRTGLGRLGAFCLAFMAFFLLLDPTLLVGHRLLPALVYQPLCFVSLGGFVAGAMGIGVAAMDVPSPRWKVTLSGMAILCVLVTLGGRRTGRGQRQCVDTFR